MISYSAHILESLEQPHLQSSTPRKPVLDQLVGALKQGQEVEIRGFGSFRFRTRPARKGRNPRTGASVDVAAKKVVFFKMGKELAALLCADPAGTLLES